MDLITSFFSNVYNVPELIRLVGFYGLHRRSSSPRPGC